MILAGMVPIVVADELQAKILMEEKSAFFFFIQG